MNAHNDPTIIKDFYVEFGKRDNKITESHSRPSLIDSTNDASKQFIYASNNLNLYRDDHPAKGKWMIFIPIWDIDLTWDKVKKAIQAGELREAKVTTRNRLYENHAIFIYAYNSNNYLEVKELYKSIVELDLVPKNAKIKYKTDEQTLNNQYGKDAYLYTSEQINRDIMIDKLNDYALKRSSEQGFSAFFRNLAILDEKVKTAACNKLKNFYLEIEYEKFTDIELKGLGEGTLHDLVIECRERGLKLPQAIETYDENIERNKLAFYAYSKQY